MGVRGGKGRGTGRTEKRRGGEGRRDEGKMDKGLEFRDPRFWETSSKAKV